MHDTEGWRALETSFTALQRVMRGAGVAVAAHVDTVLPVVQRSLSHTNRFVRETGYQVIACICDVCDEPTMLRLRVQLTTSIATGLADNWSQVRFAASVACRALMTHAALSANNDARSASLDVLLPPMSLNQHYVAEGVRLYSQSTWKMVFGAQGAREAMPRRASLIAYYSDAADADNHAVREAAAAVAGAGAPSMPCTSQYKVYNCSCSNSFFFWKGPGSGVRDFGLGFR